MPTYSITGPDGKTYSIDGPAGATKDQVIAKIKETHSFGGPSAKEEASEKDEQGREDAFGRSAENLFTMDLAQPARALDAGGDYDTNMSKIKSEDDALAKKYPLNTLAGGAVGLGASLASGVGEAELAGEGIAKVAKPFMQRAVEHGAANSPVVGGVGLVHGAATTPGDIGKKAEGAVTEGAIGTVGGGLIPATAESIGAAWNKLTPAIKQQIQKLTDSGKIDEVNEIIRNAVSGLTGKVSQPKDSQNIYATLDQLTKKGQQDAGPLYEKAFAGGSIAPLEKQFEGEFTRVANSEREAQKKFAEASNKMTLAEAKISRAGENVYNLSAANKEKAAAQKAMETAQKKLEAIHQEKESILDDLRTSQEHRESGVKGGVYDPRINQFLKEPIVQKGIQRGLKIQRLEALAENKKFNPNEYAIKGYDKDGEPIVGKVLNFRALDSGKRGLDAMLEDYRDPVTGKLNLDEMGRAISKVRDSYVTELDRVNPDYKPARDAYAGPAQSKDAVWKGRNFLNPDSEVSKKYIDTLTPENKKYFLSGAERDVQDMMADTQTGHKKLVDAFNTPSKLEKINLVFPKNHLVYQEARNSFIKELTETAAVKGSDKQSPDVINLKSASDFISKHETLVNSGIFDKNQVETLKALQKLSYKSTEPLKTDSKMIEWALKSVSHPITNAVIGGAAGLATHGMSGAVVGAGSGAGLSQVAELLRNTPEKRVAQLVMEATRDPEMAKALNTPLNKATPQEQLKVLNFLSKATTSAPAIAQTQQGAEHLVGPKFPAPSQQQPTAPSVPTKPNPAAVQQAIDPTNYLQQKY